MSRIDSSSFNSPSFDSGMHPSGANVGAGAGGLGQTGQLGGQQVTVDGGPSMLADAAEEISLHHSEKAEQKHSAERKKEVHEGPDLMKLEEIQTYLQATEDFSDPEEMAQLAKRMLSGQGDPQAQAKKAFDEPAGQHVALQYALLTGEKEGADPAVLDDLREALADLEMEHGPAIRANLNTIGTAAEGATSREQVLAFQSTYQDVVLGEASLSATLKLAVEKFGTSGADLATGLQRLVKALGQDMAAARPSGDPTRLQHLVQDLYHLGVAATVLDGCRELQASQATRHGAAGSDFGPGPAALMQDLVGVSGEKWVASSRFSNLAEKFGAREPTPAVTFLTGVKGLMREMPVKVFVDGDQRNTVFQAVQEALDTAIDREEY